MPSRLSPLQQRILRVLAGSGLDWTLTGGGALVGYHFGHRVTEDLDLFFAGRATLDREPDAIEQALSSSGLTVVPVQRTPGFVRFRVSDESDVVMVDVVADPVPRIEEPVEAEPGIRVDTPHEILVNKVCALLSRSELRDLEDVRVLVARGGDLDRALVEASQKDGGFSPMTLAWLLPQLPFARSHELGFDEGTLRDFADEMVARLTA